MRNCLVGKHFLRQNFTVEHTVFKKIRFYNLRSVHFNLFGLKTEKFVLRTYTERCLTAKHGKELILVVIGCDFCKLKIKYLHVCFKKKH